MGGIRDISRVLGIVKTLLRQF